MASVAVSSTTPAPSIAACKDMEGSVEAQSAAGFHAFDSVMTQPPVPGQSCLNRVDEPGIDQSSGRIGIVFAAEQG